MFLTNPILWINGIIIIAGISIFSLTIYKAKLAGYCISLITKIKFALIGILALFCDTIGVGSFATSMAMIKASKALEDEKIPPYLNLMQVLPNTLEAVLFLTVINVDFLTFSLLVGSSIIGGYISGRLVAFLPRQQIRIAMLLGLALVAVLLILKQSELLDIGGAASGLRGIKLAVATICFFFIGGLPAIGVGGYAAMQVLLFLLGMTPIAVFPIMTTSGALQQSATTFSFLKSHKDLPLKEAIYAAIFGCIGVIVAFFMLKSFTPEGLHWLLLMVILYNIYMIGKSYLQEQRIKKVL